jgi:glycosyltransferase involved in cell wall biosynthesis
MKFSIVTPSFNQARFLERAMRSVLEQQVEDLEYLVLDGGSADGSVDIIRRYSDRLAFWRSRPDGGYADALNEGFARTSGSIMGWLNSDDMLTPWALSVVESVFQALPQVQWLTTLFPLVMDEKDSVVAARRAEGYHARAFYRGRNVPLNPRFYSSVIQQESTFWRREVWERAGATMDASLRMAGDFELWARFFQHTDLYAVNVPISCFRYQRESFTSTQMPTYLDECRKVLRRYPDRSPSGLETCVRRMARHLPGSWYPLTGLAYPVYVIRKEGRESDWRVNREWIL